MEYIVGIAVIAALVGGVLWNHRTKQAAFTGVGFEVPLPPAQVADVVSAVYCQGAKASVRSTFSGVSVRRQGPTEFLFETKLGDTDWIKITAAETGSAVEAETTSLHIGGTLLSDDGSPIWRLSKTLTDLIYKVLGLAPFAARMKRFQNGLERKVGNHIHRQLQS
ncbi:hypothetical protein [Streptomyces sp. SID13031]|uniref:hypothetical protein n=1 Tax=Streptomyces sp. SID13031 TaxID=2706046 RepID=UPI0013CD0C92|nr:hypothetical protein [Streptomyces sp. SID13031]NEA32814.1 hypothetical protein [Streptomyces sp. SID13031]